jgi:hypothetical protein
MSHLCPNTWGFYFHPETGERVPRRCNRLSCGFCGPLVAYVTAEAIAMSLPTEHWVITRAGRDFQQIRKRMNSVFHKLRATAKFEAAWVVHLKKGKLHVHIVAWGGDLFGLEDLTRAARNQGMGPHVEWLDMYDATEVIPRYILRPALVSFDHRDASLEKSEAVLRNHLDINGGRLVHNTKGFWRTSDRKPLSGLKAARAVAPRRPAVAPFKPFGDESFDEFLIRIADGSP